MNGHCIFRRNGLRSVWLVTFALASVPRNAMAQNERCPAADQASEYDLERLTDIFADSASGVLRAALKLERMPSAGIKQVVSDEATCVALRRATAWSLDKVFQARSPRDTWATSTSELMPPADSPSHWFTD